MKPDRFRIGALAGLLIVLLAAAKLITDNQAVERSGRTVLLETAPVDPRALLMGDYMQLAFAEGRREDLTRDLKDLPRRGHVILSLDQNNVGRVVRFDDGTPPAPDQMRFPYRRDEGGWRQQLVLGADRFYFAEGSAELYQPAKFAIFKVADGRILLTGLATEDRVPIIALKSHP